MYVFVIPQSPAEYDMLYRERAAEEGYNSSYSSPTVMLSYDAMWVLALGLNRTQEMVDRNDSEEIAQTGCNTAFRGTLVPLHEFDYTNGLMGCLIRWNLQLANFSGVTVGSSFMSHLAIKS